MNPGEMGASVAAAARSTGHTVLWCDGGRGERTHQRATEAGLEAVHDMDDFIARSEVLLSVCPPHAAGEVAAQAARRGFSGLYLDANAVSPGSARGVCASVTGAGARYVDGGIIGPPARKPGSTRLYLSGEHAAEAVPLFQGSLLEPMMLDGNTFAASAMKMSYAAWTKGSTALQANVRALARASGVEEALNREWELSQPGLEQRSRGSITGSAFKAWRWIAEMHEIADTFEAADLPDGFHRAAAEIYTRLQEFKDQDPPPLEEALAALLTQRAAPTGDG
jgi:3-hydroxyisobutyrate dehydrogenase-like beta-hydroxyacid dehydrogenase